MAGSQKTRPRFADTAGVASIAEAELLFSAANERVLIASLPAGAVILAAWVEVITAFNAGTTNVVTLGYGAVAAATADDYVPTVTEGTPGVYGQAAPGVPFPALAAAQDVYAFYSSTGTAPTTGKARAFIQYVRTAVNG